VQVNVQLTGSIEHSLEQIRLGTAIAFNWFKADAAIGHNSTYDRRRQAPQRSDIRSYSQHHTILTQISRMSLNLGVKYLQNLVLIELE